VSTPLKGAFATRRSGRIRGLCRVEYRRHQGTRRPNHARRRGRAFPLYSVDRNLSNPVTFDTIGSSFDTLLAVYTGNAVSSLTLVGSMTTSPTPQT